MKTCPNCQTKTTGNFCPACGYNLESVSEFTPPHKRKGKVSAIIRLIILALSAILGIVTLIAGTFRVTNMTPIEKAADLIASSGLIFLMGIWLWGLVKWCVFAIPYTFRATKAIVTRIIPLSFFALIVEIMFGIWLTLIPISIYSITLTPLLSLAEFLKNNIGNIVLPLIMFVVSFLLLALIARIDYRKITAPQQRICHTQTVSTYL